MGVTPVGRTFTWITPRCPNRRSTPCCALTDFEVGIDGPKMSVKTVFLFLLAEDLSVLSEDVASLMSPDERFDTSHDWLPQSSTTNTTIQETEYGQELISKGPPKAEVQLR